MDGIDFKSLDKRWLGICIRGLGRVVFEIEEASHELQCVLINMQAQWQQGGLEASLASTNRWQLCLVYLHEWSFP